MSQGIGQDQHLATVEIRQYGKGFEPGLEEAPEQPQYRTLEIRKFITDVAHIRVGRKSAVQVIPEIWRSVSIVLDVPCYYEEIEEAKSFALEYVTQEIVVEENKLLLGQTEYYRTGGEESRQKMRNILEGE